MPESKSFLCDPDRLGQSNGTGVYVRAQDSDGRWVNADIDELDTDSLYRWLRSRGGDNPWAESIVLLLLGHDHTYTPEVPMSEHSAEFDALARVADLAARYAAEGERMVARTGYHSWYTVAAKDIRKALEPDATSPLRPDLPAATECNCWRSEKVGWVAECPVHAKSDD